MGTERNKMEEINVTFQVCEHIDPEDIVRRLDQFLEAHAYAVHQVDPEHKVVSFVFPLAQGAKEKKLIRKFEKLVKKANKDVVHTNKSVKLEGGEFSRIMQQMKEIGILPENLMEHPENLKPPTDEDYAEFFGKN